MTDRIPTGLAAAARYGVVVAAGAYLILYLATALWRLPHPFELNWMEGAMVDHVQRIAAGQRIYVAPSLEFVPFIYPPAFYYASAGVAQVTGVGFLALRLVSFLSSLGILALLYLFVARETRDRFAAAAATGLFAATYSLGGTYLDVGRVDALFLLLLLGALFVLRFHASVAAHALGGLLVGLAFLTKQSAVVMAAPVVLYVLYRQPRRGAVTAVVAGAAMLGATLLLDAAHDGWYRFYAFDLPSGYQMQPRRLVDFWRLDVLPPLAIAWVAGSVYLLAGGAAGPRLFHLAAAAGLVAGSWMSRGNPGGSDNVLIPAFLAACLLFGLGLHRARTLLATLPAGAGARAEAWLAAVCLLQFAVLAYDPRHRLPDRDDVAAGRELVRTLAAVDGEVWVPYRGFLAAMAGKPSAAHWMAVSDILRSRHESLRVGLQREIDAALGAQRYRLIVDSSHPFRNAPMLDRHYVARGAALHDEDVLLPVTGARRRVETIYEPRPDGAGGAADDVTSALTVGGTPGGAGIDGGGARP